MSVAGFVSGARQQGQHDIYVDPVGQCAEVELFSSAER